MDTDRLLTGDECPREGALCVRYLLDGRELCVYVRMFNTQLVVGQPGAMIIDDAW